MTMKIMKICEICVSKCSSEYRKNPKYTCIQTPQKFAVITLKFEQDGFTKELCTQTMQLELQTV